MRTSILSAFTLLPTLAYSTLITDLKEGIAQDGKDSGIRRLSLLGDTQNKLISTSFVSIDRCPEDYDLGAPCVTFKLANEGQLDDMSDHPGATERQRNFLASPELDSGSNTVSWNMMLEKAVAQPGFFHLAQIIGDGGPSWTMSIFQQEQGDTVAILDATTPEGKDGVCDSMSLATFMSAPMAVSVSLNRVTQSIHWAVTNLKTKRIVMTCHKHGNAGLTSGSSVQGGAYRRVLDDGLTKSAIAHVGNFILTKDHYGRLVNPRKSSRDTDGDDDSRRIR